MSKTITFVLCFMLLGLSAFAAETSDVADTATENQPDVKETAVSKADNQTEAAAEEAAQKEEELAEKAEEELEDTEEELENVEETAKEVVEEKSGTLQSKQLMKSDEILAYDISKYTTLGVGLGLIAVGVTYGFFAKNDMDDYNDKYSQYSIVDKDLYDSSKQKALISTSTYIAGGVVLGASITLFILDALDVGESPLRKLGFIPILGPKTQGASVSVRF